MRLAIVGAMENINEVDVKAIIYEFVHTVLNQGTKFLVVVSGGTKGVDTIAREAAADWGFPFILFKPQFMLDPSRERNDKDFWIRDKQVVDNSDIVLIIGPKDCKRCIRVEKHAKRRGKKIERRVL